MSQRDMFAAWRRPTVSSNATRLQQTVEYVYYGGGGIWKASEMTEGWSVSVGESISILNTRDVLDPSPHLPDSSVNEIQPRQRPCVLHAILAHNMEPVAHTNDSVQVHFTSVSTGSMITVQVDTDARTWLLIRSSQATVQKSQRHAAHVLCRICSVLSLNHNCALLCVSCCCSPAPTVLPYIRNMSRSSTSIKSTTFSSTTSAVPTGLAMSGTKRLQGLGRADELFLNLSHPNGGSLSRQSLSTRRRDANRQQGSHNVTLLVTRRQTTDP
ncbi:hypothetical protein CONLIGDRAFT_685914 [Coniochaeta ligniaria NRRL 30616]|uniref:Uncharacterized protein n=1 Tax=Coniochaeta ligniaria NRRL 30616 TaxID=1408157 RepID=A0A1J7IA11_9PEZI|nr:hypothetical protein CONLIGDRAFT_685914 [Coniochaeta ligniaria NRRL 30616]